MFERFTDRARRVVVWAQEEARLFDHDYIGTEHLLLGLIREGDGVAAKTLVGMGLTLEDGREDVEARIGRGKEHPKGHIPFTPRAKKVLELSLRQALKLGHDYIGTEHILLGLLEEGQGVGVQILLTRIEDGIEAVESDVLSRLVELGTVQRGERFQHEQRQRMRQGMVRSVASAVADDEVFKRLEAIEARLSAIERMLREERGEQTS
jgi:ATP-dependent Clp protease ATP-binding subunit ClpA